MALTSRLSSCLVALLPFFVFAQVRAQELASVSLCRALERVEPGDQIPVVVSGIYTVDYLYDPSEQECRLNVKPRTCIEFAKSLRRPKKFDELRKESLRIHATFKGILYGRDLEEPLINNPTIPVAARLTAVNRYCSNFHPTKLVVEKILDFKAVSEDEPWESESAYGKTASLPYPIEMKPPTYPPGARNLNAEGSVLLLLEVVEGTVASINVQFGDPVLIEEAVSNVQTWKFSSDVSTSLTVEYEFRLRKRAASEGANPSLEMRLPSYVLVIGPSNDW